MQSARIVLFTDEEAKLWICVRFYMQNTAAATTPPLPHVCFPRRGRIFIPLFPRRLALLKGPRHGGANHRVNDDDG